MLILNEVIQGTAPYHKKEDRFPDPLRLFLFFIILLELADSGKFLRQLRHLAFDNNDCFFVACVYALAAALTHILIDHVDEALLTFDSHLIALVDAVHTSCTLIRKDNVGCALLEAYICRTSLSLDVSVKLSSKE